MLHLHLRCRVIAPSLCVFRLPASCFCPFFSVFVGLAWKMITNIGKSGTHRNDVSNTHPIMLGLTVETDGMGCDAIGCNGCLKQLVMGLGPIYVCIAIQSSWIDDFSHPRRTRKPCTKRPAVVNDSTKLVCANKARI